MNKIKKISFYVFVVFIVTAFSIVVLFNSSINSYLNVEEPGIEYEIKPGRTLSSVIYELSHKNIISHPRILLLYAKLSGLASKMKAGQYNIDNSLTTGQLLDNIFSGKVIQHSISIIEGWTFKQMLNAIHQHPKITNTVDNIAPELMMQKLGYQQHYEGMFLPDTYLFPDGITDIEFLKRAYQSMEETLSTEWENRAVGLPYKSPYEALIMASIIEKETGKPDEREEIAGVFVRRLEKGMRLQTDPTVIYGMGDRYKGNVRKKDLLKDTPYNTYRRKGLPPTPIALPGRAAIYAALHPAEGKALYFVSRGDGSHVFSETLDEHNKAVIKYQLKGRARNFSSYKHK